MWGCAPHPGVYRSGFLRGDKKGTMIIIASPVTHKAARLAPRCCSIIPCGKATKLYHSYHQRGTRKNECVLDMECTFKKPTFRPYFPCFDLLSAVHGVVQLSPVFDS